MGKPAISVIIPVYNVEKYLADCLESVIEQSLKDIEIICVNDGSFDNSSQILDYYQKRDSRVIVLDYHINKGQAYARNCGLKKATGEYVYFVDSDDKVKEDTLSFLYNQACRYGVDGVWFIAESFSEEGYDKFGINFKKDYLTEKLSSGVEIFSHLMKVYEGYKPYVWCQFWKRTYLVENNLFFQENTSPHEDVLFSFKAIIEAEKIKFINKPLYMYRRRGGAVTTTSVSSKKIKAYFIVYAEIIMYIREKCCSISTDNIHIIGQYVRYLKDKIRRLCIEYTKKGHDLSDVGFERGLYETVIQTGFLDHYSIIPEFITANNLVEIAKYECVVVYGAGKVGKEVVNQLLEYEIYNFFVAVTKKKYEEERFLGYDVHEISDFQDRCGKCLVIVAVTERYQDDMIQYLKEKGFPNYICMI